MYLDRKRYEQTGKFSFLFTDKNGKKIRLKQSEVPSHIKTIEDAENYCRMKNAEEDAARIRAERKLEWRNRYFNFEELSEEFSVVRRKEAPKGGKLDAYYFRAYTLDFFLNKMDCPSPLLWSDYFGRFRDWLDDEVEPINRGKGSKVKTGLSISTRIKIVQSLNHFLDFMHRKKGMEKMPNCDGYDRKQVFRRGLESVISDVDIVRIREELMSIRPVSSDFFFHLTETGERESEGLGTSLDSISKGEPKSPELLECLQRYGLTCYGYITLDSQIAESVRVRNEDGIVPRMPLKARDSITPENNRTIPILSKEHFNMLVARWKVQKEKYDQRLYGDDRQNYLLFEGINGNTFYNDLTKACERLKIRHYSPHCCRHTAATRIAGITRRNYDLARLVLGHRDERETRMYAHLFEELQRRLEQDRQVAEGLEFIS